jgi:hypothetical protein
MRAVVVYESMYGNTHEVAEQVCEGLRSLGFEADVRPVGEAAVGTFEPADLVVVGGPTHAHSMSRTATRKSAAVQGPQHGLSVEPDAEGPGLREWFAGLPKERGQHRMAAAFDTRVEGPVLVTGHASKSISAKLRQHGFELVADPESFLVDKGTKLVPGETARAALWGRRLAEVSKAHSIETAGR